MSLVARYKCVLHAAMHTKVSVAEVKQKRNHVRYIYIYNPFNFTLIMIVQSRGM
jgi:hypothetical protein